MTTLFFEENQRYPPGHPYLPHDHEGLVKLTHHWGFGENEMLRASTWLPNVLVAASPNLKEIIDAVKAAPLKEWKEQLGRIDFASIHSGPVLSRPIEEAILGLIDSLDSLLRSGITAAVPWLGKPRHSDLLSRLVFACTQTLLQRGREVVCGRAAYAVGRADCSVLCSMASDLKLFNEVGVRPTLFSVINLISPQCGQGFGVSTQLFSTRFDANYKLRANLFLKRQLRLGTIELSAFLPPILCAEFQQEAAATRTLPLPLPLPLTLALTPTPEQEAAALTDNLLSLCKGALQSSSGTVRAKAMEAGQQLQP